MKKYLLFISIFLVFLKFPLAQTEKYPLQIGDKNAGASWSPNNDLILTSTGEDNNLRLWEVSTGKVIWKKDVGFLQDKTESYGISADAWSSNQKYILTGTANGKIQLWEVKSGNLIWNIKAHSNTIETISISPDRKVFISSADAGNFKSELKIWNLEDGKLLKNFGANHKSIDAVRFIDNEKFQTGNGIGQISVWAINQPNSIQTKQLKPCGFIDNKISEIIYSPNFNFIAAQCQNSLVITNVKTGKILKKLSKEKHYREPSFSPNERILLLPNTIDSKTLDLQTRMIKEYDEFDDGVINNDGNLIAANSFSANGTQIYNLKTGKRQMWLVGHPGVIKSIVFSPDGNRFATGSADRILRIWDTKTKQILLSLEGHTDAVESVEYSSNGKSLISKSDKETIVWNAENGAKIKVTKTRGWFYENRGDSLSLNGKFALVREYEKPIRLVDAKSKETIKEFIYIDQLDSLIFTPNEKYFLAKPWWNGWQLWSVETGQPIHEFDVGYSYHNRVAFHPDGKTFLTGGEGQNLLMFNLETGEKIWSLFPIDQEEFEQKKNWEAHRVGFLKWREEYAARADIENQERVRHVTAEFSHYGDAESFWDQKIAESGMANKSKLKLLKEKAKVAWFTLMNDSDMPISIDTNSMIYNPKCGGLCNGSEISSRYVLELKDGKTSVNGYDMFSKTLLLPKMTVYFSISLEHFAASKAIYLGFTFQKDNLDDKNSDDYGTEQKLYFRESELP